MDRDYRTLDGPPSEAKTQLRLKYPGLERLMGVEHRPLLVGIAKEEIRRQNEANQLQLVIKMYR